MTARGTSSSGRSHGNAGRVGPGAWHGRQSMRSGAAQQLQQHGFRLIVLMMREQNAWTPPRSQRRTAPRNATGVPRPRRSCARPAQTSTRRSINGTSRAAQSSAQSRAHASAWGESP